MPDVALHEGDIRTIEIGRPFDVVTCLFSVIGYMLTLEDLRDAVGNMARHLIPGGILIVEPWLDPEAIRPPEVTVSQAAIGDMRVTRHSRLEKTGLGTSRMEFHYLCSTPAEVRYHLEVLDHGLFTRDELMSACTAAGLTPRMTDRTGHQDEGS